MSSSSVFATDPDFCSSCGSILPVAAENLVNDQCLVCEAFIDRTELGEISYVVHFNDPDVYSKEKGIASGGKKHKNKKKSKQPVAEGPMVDRECRECGNKQMSYATLQLRSADEGQTVFYTCPKCKFKESENS